MRVDTRLILRGDYDIWRRQELRETLDHADLSRDVEIDLTETTLMDAGSAAMLIALQHRLHAKNPQARVILFNAPPIVKRVLALCGVSDLFVFAADR